MDSNELVASLRSERNVDAVTAGLRERVRSAASPEEASHIELALGRVLDERQGDKHEALKSYEGAFRADPRQIEALARARGVFLFLGKLPNVAKALDFEIKASASDPGAVASLLVLLGDTQWDLGDVSAAEASYSRALDVLPGDAEALDRIDDVKMASIDAASRAIELETDAQRATGADAAKLWLRAARVIRATDAGRAEGALIQGLHADPTNETVAVLLDAAHTAAGRAGSVSAHEDAILAKLGDDVRPEIAELFGLRALHRRADGARAQVLLERAAGEGGREAARETLKRVAAAAPVATAAVAAPVVAAAPAPVAAPPPVARPAPDPAKIAALDEQVAKFETAKRWADVVKTLAQKAEMLADDAERVAVFERIAQVHSERTNNAAEAIKAFEAVLEIDPSHAAAREFLKSRYEQRRDWEKLLNLLRREAQEAPEYEQLDRWLSIAKLATEKVKKPELCIELWERVLERDGSHPEALAQLAGFYDRAKEFDKLASVLREQAAQTGDAAQKIQLLVKLGTIAGDKLNNDDLAVEAWRGVLMLDPNDRRAQEALKKRYLAMHAWDELEVFYADSGKWDELIRVLERESEQPGATNETKIKLFFKIAQLWADRKEKTDRAAKYYEKVLEIEASNRAASLALIPIYAAANDSKKLATAYEVKLAGDEGDERVETLRTLGELYEVKLKDAPKAYERFAAAFEAAPTDDRSAVDLERSAGAASKVAEAAQLMDRVAAAESGESANALILRAGRLYAGPIGNTDEAITRFRAVLDRDADSRDALAALDELFRKTSRWSDLHGVLERRLERAEGPDERREVLYAIGALSEGELNKPESAVDTYVAVLTEYGDETEALRRLDALYTRLERWEELASILERELVALADDEDAALDAKFRLGRTLHAHLNRTKDAIDHFREILSLNPEHASAREALEMLLREPESRGEAARILEPIYELRGDWEALIRALEILLTDESDVEQRVSLLRKIGDVCSVQIGDADRAFEAYGRALLEDPARVEVRDQLESMADSINAWPRFVALLRQVTEKNVAPEVAREAWLKIASVEDSKLGQAETSIESFKNVLAADAGDADARDALEALLRRTERWPALLESFRGRLELTQDPEQREQVLSAIASVQDSKLNDPEAAISTFREMLSADPASSRALSALDQLFERLGRWNDLADNLQARLDLSSDPEEQTQLMLRLARLREEKMSQVDAAVEIYRQVLQRDATNADALAALERLVQQPEHAAAVAEILEAVYRESAAYDRLVAVHEIQVGLATDPLRKVELLHRIAELQETALDDPGSAFRTFGRALAEDPTNEETVAGLERLARAHQAFAELATAYEQRVEAVEDVNVKVSLHQRAAVVHEELLQNADGAIGHYRAILALDARNVDAVSALERLYQLGEKYDALAETYLQKASLLESPDEAKAYLFRASEIYETVLERPDAAVGVYRKVLEVDAEDLNAVDALVRLHVAQGSWAELLDVQQRKIDLVGDPDEKKRLYFEVGSVYESELKDVAKAIDSYNKVLELDPSDLTALQRLDQLYLGQQNWQELLSVLDREADLASDPDEVNAYRYRVAEIHEKQVGDVARAVEIYRGILDATPDHQPTLEALENILRGDKEPVSAAAVLEPVYTASGSFDRLVGVLEVQLAHTQEPADRVALLHRIAELQETALDNSRAAFDAFKRALPSDALHEDTLANIERLADTVAGWPEVGAAYDAELAKLSDEPQKLVELGLRTARIYEVQLGNVDVAIERYRAVLAADGQNGDAARALDRLYEAGEKWQELAAITKVAIALPDASPEEVVALRFKLAQVNEGPLGDIDAALAAYREVLDVEPEHSPTVAALESMFGRGVKQAEVAAMLRPIYEGQGEWQKLAQLNEQALTLVSDPAERIAAMHALADLNESQLADGVGAINWHMRALRESPLDERSFADGERLAGTMDAWTDLASCYADIVEASADENVKRIVGKRLGRVYEEELRDVENAEASYNYVLSVAPLEADALERLDVIYSGLGNAERLAQVLDRRAQAVEDPTQKIEFTLRHAQILENDLQQAEPAIARYRVIVDQLDASHPESLDALDRLYTAANNAPELYKVLEKKGENATSDIDRSELFTRQAQMAAGPLNRPDDAVRLLNEVLTLRGEDPDALEVLATLHQNAGKWDDLVDTLERQLVSTDDYDRKAQIGLRIASVHEQARNDLERAVESYRRVLDIDSGNDAAYVALEEIFRRTENWDELSATLNQHIQVGAATLDASRQRAIWAELAMLYQNIYQQHADAVTSWRNVLDVSANDEEAIAKLLELHAAADEWREVVEVLKIRVNAQSIDEAKIPILVEIATVWEDKIQEPDGARESYEQILAVDNLHDRAFQKLEVLHRDNARWEPLVDMYIARFDALGDDDAKEKVDLLRRAAKVYDANLNDNEQAYAAAMLAYETDVSDKETVALLERLAAIGAKWNDLLSTSNDWWKTAQDPRWTHIGLNMAKWYGVDLNKPEWALPIYQQVLARQPDNLLALHSMTALYRKLQQWPQLTQLLERCMAVARTEEDRRKVHVELGEVLELHLNQPDAAVEHYKTALNLNARDVAALTALERVYEGRGNGVGLVDVLYRKADALAAQNNIEQANAVRLKLAEVLEDRANDPERAVEVHRAAVAADASNLPALRGLERLYARLGRSADLLGALEAQLDHVSVEREKIKLLTRVAEMQEEEFVKLPEASARFEQVVEIDPNNDHAYRGLERLYRRQSRWNELLSALDRHISATAERKERVPLFTAMGQVYAEELNDQDRAIDGFQNALDIDYTYLPALEGLARVYEKRGEWDRAIETLRTLSDHERDPVKQVDIRYRIGKLAEDQLKDEDQALDLYRSALDVNDAHAPSLGAIRQIFQRRGDQYDAAQYLEREINATEAPRAKAKLFYELGRIWNDHLDERDKAVACFESSIKADPDLDDAAFPLVFHYAQTAQWEAAEPLAEVLVRKSARRTPEEQLQLQLVMGRVAMKLGKVDRAIKALSTAHGLDRSNVEVLSELALAYFEKKDWENAFKNYHLLVVHHKDDMAPEGRAELYFRIGVVKREQGDRRRAINFLDKALEEVPNHRPTLEALVETYAQDNQWEQVIGYKRAIFDNHLTDNDERYNMLVDIAGLWQDKAKNPQKAIQSFNEALEIKGDSNNILLMKLLGLYQETKQWSRVVETVTKMSEVEKDPAKKSRYAYTVASIYNNEIKNPDEAVNWYNAALDLNPSDLKSFEKINQILTAKKEFKQLERSYRKMLHRITGKGNRDLEFSLWHALGLIYRDRLDKKAEAITAFESASKLKPEDETEQKILAELYTMAGESQKAIESWTIMLRREINNPAALKAVYDLHYATRQYDKAWCVANTMCFLLRDNAPADARAFYEQYKPRRPLAPQSRLDEERWIKDLFHQDEDPFVGKMFACILPALRRVKVRPVAQFGFTAADQQNPQTSSVALVRAMGLSAAALNLPQMPAIFLRPQQPGGLAYVPSDPWSSVSGSSLLQGMQPVDLQFIAAKHMSYYRPEHYVRTLFPTVAELTMLLLAAIKLVKGDFDVPPEVMATVQTLAQQMQQDPVNLEGLRKVVKIFLDQGGQVNIKKWFQSVELTACRAGFLLCGDLDVSKKMIAMEPGLPGDVAPTEKLKDVILFSISEPYFRLREALGITFQAAAAY
jgi:tetratricopeptide (TPR) repeat protein